MNTSPQMNTAFQRSLVIAIMVSVLSYACSLSPASDPVPGKLNSPQALQRLQLRTIDNQPLTIIGGDKPAWTVLVFISRTCPIANAYQPRLRELQQQFESQGVRFVQVYVQSDVTVDEVRSHMREYDIKSQVVIDSDRQLTRAIEAKVTPEAFIVDHHGQVLYRGRIDDQFAALGKKRPQPTRHDLAQALKECTSGAGVSLPVTPAIGCLIAVRQAD